MLLEEKLAHGATQTHHRQIHTCVCVCASVVMNGILQNGRIMFLPELQSLDEGNKVSSGMKMQDMASIFMLVWLWISVKFQDLRVLN